MSKIFKKTVSIIFLLLILVLHLPVPVVHAGNEYFTNTNFDDNLNNWTTSTGISTSNLKAYWKLDEATGTTRVDSFGSNNLTDNGGVTQVVGKVGNAAHFSNPQYLVNTNTNLPNGDQDYTVNVWVYLDSKSGNSAILKKGNTSDFDLFYIQSIDRFEFTQWDNVGGIGIPVDADSLGSPSINTWYFITLRRNITADSISIQVNGGAEDSTTLGGFVLPGPRDDYFFLGDGVANSNRADEVSVFNKVLSSTERTALYNSGLGNTYSPSTRNTNVGAASVTGFGDTTFLQSVNVKNTLHYNLSALAYTDGSTVTSSDAVLYANGAVVPTSYTPIGGGWYRLTGNVIGVNQSVGYGVQVKNGKTVLLDSFSLQDLNTPAGPPTCNITAPSAPKLISAIPQSPTSIKLTFTPGNNSVDSFFLRYGIKSNTYIYGGTNIGGKNDQTYLINDLAPNTTYFFQVGDKIGCATSNWSNEISATTTLREAPVTLVTENKKTTAPSVSKVIAPTPHPNSPNEVKPQPETSKSNNAILGLIIAAPAAFFALFIIFRKIR